ncbi:MAG: DUF1343 domain-containing protein, partial [Candidatus Hydrogenedentes bacterium]|nr:DUF1343 domain-containing protein [Candidatus Hydrogenedentota bacterium]
AILMLRDDGLIDLDARASVYVPVPAFSAFTIRQLLTHTSGLTAGKPLYRDVTSMDEMLSRYAAMPLESKPGAHRRYSDVGFMILGRAVELAARDSLDAFCRKRIFAPLGMEHTTFNPPAEWAAQCAATERCPWRRRLIQGEVHDENASAVGGVSGHAGLFSTTGDLARFCRALLSGQVLPEATLDEMTRFAQVPYWPWQGLGWQLDPWSSAPTGFLPARTAFGHTGWTGVSLWTDRQTGLFAILLANTCHPTRDARDNETLRRTFYTGVAESFYPDTTSAHSGLDRLLRDQFDEFRGRRVALLTHHAATDQQGRSILDVFALAPDVRIACLYSPEHGLRGHAEAGAKVGAQEGPVPVVSLYGKRQRPSAAELAGIDFFVIDLQDVGSRYYTYVHTMKECLAACAEARKPVVVLDRPNPVGGAILEGPVAADAISAVCWGPVPVRHGMTLAEAALFLAERMPPALKPTVLVRPLDNWTPERLFAQCALPWVPPSPNIPTPETALLYVGMCLFEGTNLNEGRGTDTPFHVIGAPWLDPEAVIEAIAPEEHAGCTLDSVTFTPRSIPGKASRPRYMDKACRGIRVTLDDPCQARPFTLALALLSAVNRIHRNAFEWTSSFDTLAGSDDLRKRIAAGQPPSEIVARFEPGLAAFNACRPRLYCADVK